MIFPPSQNFLCWNITKFATLDVASYGCIIIWTSTSIWVILFKQLVLKLTVLNLRKTLLGILFDHQLKFHLHTTDIAAKANCSLGLIKRSFNYLDPDMLIKIFVGYSVLSVLASYIGILQFGNCNNCHLQPTDVLRVK